VEAPQTIVFGSIVRTRNHTYAMDLVWKAHLEGQSHGFLTRRPQECPALSILDEHQSAVDAWSIGYASDLSAEQAGEALDFDFIGGGRGRMTRQDILYHVVNHSTYHRGHVGDMMYNAGIHPPTTDLRVYLREIC
jgi:uncharacterized damage-inducible protein DinB